MQNWTSSPTPKGGGEFAPSRELVSEKPLFRQPSVPCCPQDQTGTIFRE